ncbi:putative GYF domain-containing protein mpd2 [Glarea lozoyensis 74030]|uniref:Putative GYF domain-containing protein mpd2 n=1 Tax=Glarea lozoyensis (strain ATCC 74030 / MF5533) TaxID=1104152 RepID=H0EP92_GLAL7|nr:putative GYF domain-containing protein mpd2 [Glarea lozoyensis 74030]
MGELQSPSLGNLGVFGPGASGNVSASNTAGRGTIGRNAFTPSRETGSPMRTGRHPFEDLFPPPSDNARGQGLFSSSEMAPGQTATAFGQTTSAQSGYQQSQGSSDSASNPSSQLPTAQQRMMVMPDRMRWVYLDPQGHVQGPWSGLEMHDWYKASFFTADLSVKKVEDADFEPLGQLIRRIGNSREPFLVPQIGIPHGAPTIPTGNTFTPAANTPGNNNAAQSGSVQPPFAGAFPSFGTTLTAEQQNNLERRKQEEQYLMARQREFLAQQQVNMKQMQLGGLPSSLHHHSSAHSLQSQPSFGSISSPIGMPGQPPLPTGVSGFFDQVRQVPGQSGRGEQNFLEEEMARMELERQKLYQMGAPGGQSSSHASQIAAIFGQQQAPPAEQNDPQGFKARLRQFEQLREEHDMEEAQAAGNATNNPIGPPQQVAPEMRQEPESIREEEEYASEAQQPEVLSMTQQVQKAVSAKHSPITTQPESPWGKVNTNLPMPFPPPPQSTTPLPAPTAQRGRSNLPDTLNAETRSRSETPDTANAPSLAPWAKESIDAPKHQSLKEIQEMEAKKAAKAEEAAAAHRRQLLEQEMKLLSAQPAAPAPGLPTTSTWGNTASPTTSGNVASAWAKPTVASKAQASSSSAASKKTLADIQREEENRKNKLAAAALAAQPAPTVSGGKRYADLASKASAALPPMGSAWSTVGAGGKVRVPTGPASVVPPPPTSRAVSSANISASSRTVRPAAVSRSVTSSASTGATSANEEFTKWAKGSLAKGLNSDINVDSFIGMLLACPAEPSIIADAVYSSSQLMDGRRFAEEFLRRRKLAEKGVVEPANTGSGTSFSTAGEKSSGGWSEVAKKGPPKEEPAATGYKVVPNKKKGKK